MASMQMIDVLRRGEQFHKQLAAYYEQMHDNARREDVKAVLEYMSRHERYLEKCLHDYEKDVPESVKQAWFQRVPEMNLVRELENVELTPDMSVDDVIGIAVMLDELLIKVYRNLAETSLPEKLTEALTTLLEMEQEETKRMVRDLQQSSG